MSTTYDFTDGSITGQMNPPEVTTLETGLTLMRNIVDCSKQTLDAGLADVGQVLNIAGGTTVASAWARVITAETTNGNISLGYGSDPDRFGHGLAVDATGIVSPVLVATATWDPGSIPSAVSQTAAAAVASTDVTVNGAKIGDPAVASLGVDLVDLSLTAVVTAANTVTLTLANATLAAVDLASSTVTVVVNTAPLSGAPLYFAADDTIDIVAGTDIADVDLDGLKVEVCALCIRSRDTY